MPDNLSRDIRLAFPGSKDFSACELRRMAKFAATYPDADYVRKWPARIPWPHNIAIMEKVPTRQRQEWYIRKTLENGWSRDVLIHQIESGLYERLAASEAGGFEDRPVSPQSELAAEMMEDSHVLDFILFGEDVVQGDARQSLARDLTALLLGLGTGFALLGNQRHLDVGGEACCIDLLFYNLNLRCYVVVGLETGEPDPGCPGRICLQLSAVDGVLRKKSDNPSIGLLLCGSEDGLAVQYVLRDAAQPAGAAAYKVTSSLPEHLGKDLPSVEDIQKRIRGKF